MNFRDLACKHLATYREDVLKVQKPGIFRYRGEDLEKGHILPVAEREKNILEQYRARFWASDCSKVKLHQYFHHLSSSQALCFNLFYPLLAENQLDLFFDYLNVPIGEGVRKATFEKESDLEKAERRTSFDFYTLYNSANKIFVEVKYTEDGFGAAENDTEHQEKFRKTYLPLLERSRFLAPICKEEAFFLSHYQILRNLVHITEESHVVLLFPSANEAVSKEANYARDHLLTEAGRERLRIILLEDFISFLEEMFSDGVLEGYYQSFREKYVPH